MSDEMVLVTGGTGFVATHCVVQLLEAGYRVRTTVRSLAREGEVRRAVAAGLAAVAVAASGSQAGNADPAADPVADPATDPDLAAGGRLQVVGADLTATPGWAEAVVGCRYVLHVASPFPAVQPDNPNTLVAPARDGTVRVLRAARSAGVERVVLTSSFAAVGHGVEHPPDYVFTETDWSDATADVSPDAMAKTLAERAAWQYIAERAPDLELAVINPVSVFGPALGPHLSTSLLLLRGFLGGVPPAVARVSTSAVDVRDVADLHLRAMTHPDARGERFLAVTGSPLTHLQIAQLLRSRLGEAADRVPKRQLPDWTVSLMAPFTPQLEDIRLQLGTPKAARNTKAKTVLGWQPRSNVEAIVAAAESILALGLVGRG
ncbi:NAD-dependent epimerase/dehydratase family protein [Subtercola sp. YIM 133946]|uniref:NAD-dependent epimerase/dehydratase family protein n=1 Tax=Subtercola sp. YIM 133946 TaxID=3118909 RepID=UPI002F91EAD7